MFEIPFKKRFEAIEAVVAGQFVRDGRRRDPWRLKRVGFVTLLGICFCVVGVASLNGGAQVDALGLWVFRIIGPVLMLTVAWISTASTMLSLRRDAADGVLYPKSK